LVRASRSSYGHCLRKRKETEKSRGGGPQPGRGEDVTSIYHLLRRDLHENLENEALSRVKGDTSLCFVSGAIRPLTQKREVLKEKKSKKVLTIVVGGGKGVI